MRIKANELNWGNQSNYLVSKGCLIEFNVPPGDQEYIIVEILAGYITSYARRKTHGEGDIMKLPYKIFERYVKHQDTENKSFSIFNSLTCP